MFGFRIGIPLPIGVAEPLLVMFSQLIPENGTGSVLKRVLRSNGKL